MAAAGGSWKGGKFMNAGNAPARIPTFEEFSASYVEIETSGREKSFEQYLKDRGEAPIGEIDYGLLIFGGVDRYLTANQRGQRKTMLKRSQRRDQLYEEYRRDVPMTSSTRTADFTRQQDQASRRAAYRRFVRSMGGTPAI